MSDKYNGWDNWETWNAALWLDNDQGSYEYWNERAQEIYNDTEADDTFTREERACQQLSDELRYSFESENTDETTTGWRADAVGMYISEVNWYEIAEHYIADVDKTEAEESEA